MSILSNVVLFLAILVAIVFSLLVLLTGKGDAMSGGGSVRTSYKGKATFDDIMSRAALYLGVGFMALVLLYNILSGRVRAAEARGDLSTVSAPAVPPVSNNAPALNSPAGSNNSASNTLALSNNAPAANTPSNSNSAVANNASTSGNNPVNPKNPNAGAENAAATNAPATNAPKK